ncbi:retrotransposon gag protein, partial [Trifolium medium]|nr:retrotransposon gag protein [Trifolium medium]
KSVVVDEGSASVAAKSIPVFNVSPKKTTMKESGSSGLSGAALTKFRQSVKRVELPSFNGEDPAGWISRAEIYFRVQGTMPKVKVNLAQLCMEG